MVWGSHTPSLLGTVAAPLPAPSPVGKKQARGDVLPSGRRSPKSQALERPVVGAGSPPGQAHCRNRDKQWGAGRQTPGSGDGEAIRRFAESSGPLSVAPR